MQQSRFTRGPVVIPRPVGSPYYVAPKAKLRPKSANPTAATSNFNTIQARPTTAHPAKLKNNRAIGATLGYSGYIPKYSKAEIHEMMARPLR